MTIKDEKRLAELIEERRRQDGAPTFYGTFNFAEWLRGVREGWNPKDGPCYKMATRRTAPCS